MLERIAAALQDQTMKRYIVVPCDFVQSLKQAFSKADCAGNIGVFKLIIDLKRAFIPSDCFLYCGL